MLLFLIPAIILSFFAGYQFRGRVAKELKKLYDNYSGFRELIVGSHNRLALALPKGELELRREVAAVVNDIREAL